MESAVQIIVLIVTILLAVISPYLPRFTRPLLELAAALSLVLLWLLIKALDTPPFDSARFRISTMLLASVIMVYAVYWAPIWIESNRLQPPHIQISEFQPYFPFQPGGLPGGKLVFRNDGGKDAYYLIRKYVEPRIATTEEQRNLEMESIWNDFIGRENEKDNYVPIGVLKASDSLRSDEYFTGARLTTKDIEELQNGTRTFYLVAFIMYDDKRFNEAEYPPKKARLTNFCQYIDNTGQHSCPQHNEAP